MLVCGPPGLVGGWVGHDDGSGVVHIVVVVVISYLKVLVVVI